MRLTLHFATAAFIVASGLAGPAHGSYLLAPDPISFVASDGSEGLIHFYGSDIGLPPGATLLAGSIAATDAVLMFTIESTVAVTELKKVTVEIAGLPSTGAGTIVSGGVKGKKAKASGDGWKIDIDKLSTVGQLTDPLLISYASIPAGSQIDFALEFMGGTARVFGPLDEDGGLAAQAPEPASWLLVGLGLVGLSRRFAAR